VSGSGPSFRDATKQETPAFRPRRALQRGAGPRESSEGNDRALPKKLEEARRTISSNLAENDYIRPPPPESWSEHSLEKSTKQRPMAAGHRSGNAPPWGTPLMMMVIIISSTVIHSFKNLYSTTSNDCSEVLLIPVRTKGKFSNDHRTYQYMI